MLCLCHTLVVLSNLLILFFQFLDNDLIIDCVFYLLLVLGGYDGISLPEPHLPGECSLYLITMLHQTVT